MFLLITPPTTFVDHFDLLLYPLFNSCFEGVGDDLRNVVCEDDVLRRLRMWLGYGMDIDII